MRLLALVLTFSTLVTALEASASTPRKSRGTQSGGGTDVLVGSQPGAQDDVIIDFVGHEPNVVIDPKQYDGIYNALVPRLERLEYYHPGFRARFEKVFKKTWRMTLREFQPRRAGEARTIEQTEDYVDINFTWFKTTTSEQKQQAWLHEMVREYIDDGWMKKLTAFFLRKDDPNQPSEEELRWLADEGIQQLTPLIYYEETNDELFSKNFMKIIEEYITGPWDVHGQVQVTYGVPTRDSMYRNIRRGKLRKRYNEFCKDQLLLNLNRLTEALEKARRNKSQYYDEAAFGFYFTRPDLVESFASLAYSGTTHSDDFKSVYSSPALDAIAVFAVRTTSAIEAHAAYGSYELRSEKNMNNNVLTLSSRERQKAMQNACRDFDEAGLIRYLDEYDADEGKVQDYPAAHPLLTNQSEVEDALTP